MLGLSCLERSVNAVDRQNNVMINVLSVLILKEGGTVHKHSVLFVPSQEVQVSVQF